MDKESIIPSDLIETLKLQKENNENAERAIKLDKVIADKQLDLTKNQIKQLVMLRDTLSADSLSTLEEKREAAETAKETLSLLKDIADNTEESKLDVKAKGGTRSIILGLGQGLIVGFTTGLLQGIVASFKNLMKFPTFAKIFAPITRKFKEFTKPVISLFRYFGNVFRAIGDIYKKAGTTQFLKGDTRKIFNQKTIKGLQSIFAFFKGIGTFVKGIGTKIKGVGSILKSGAIKLFSPIMMWFKDLKNVFMSFKSFFSSGAGSPSIFAKILTPIKNVLGMAKHLGFLFKGLGFLFGKLIIPIVMIFDFVKGFIDEFNTSEYDNMFMKILDAALAGIGNIAGGFIGGIADLLKDGLSFVAEKLGFEGLSEWLDSFSIREMIETGMSDLLDLFDSIFTDLVPALIAGVKAAVMPGGKGFSAAFAEKMTGKESNELSELNSKIQDLRLSIFEENQKLREGDEKGGLIGFQYDRAERIQEQELEMKRLQDERNKLARSMYAELDKPAITAGAEMEAIQDDTLDAKSAASIMTPIITTTDASINTNNSMSKTVNQTNHFDKTMMMGYGQALLQ